MIFKTTQFSPDPPSNISMRNTKAGFRATGDQIRHPQRYILSFPSGSWYIAASLPLSDRLVHFTGFRIDPDIFIRVMACS